MLLGIYQKNIYLNNWRKIHYGKQGGHMNFGLYRVFVLMLQTLETNSSNQNKISCQQGSSNFSFSISFNWNEDWKTWVILLIHNVSGLMIFHMHNNHIFFQISLNKTFTTFTLNLSFFDSLFLYLEVNKLRLPPRMALVIVNLIGRKYASLKLFPSFNIKYYGFSRYLKSNNIFE